MKTFVTIGHSGRYEDSSSTNLYVGLDEEKAFSFKDNGHGVYYSFSVELWIDEVQVKGYYSDNSGETWIIGYDKTEELKRSILHNRTDLDKAESELKNLELKLG